MFADDHRLVRGALARLVDSLAGIEVVAEVDDGRQLIEALAGQDADVAVVDVAMPVLNGFDTVAQLVRDRPGVRTLILSMYTSPEYVRRAREVGADGFVAKDVDAAAFEDIIRRVARGERFLSAPAGLDVAEGTSSPSSDPPPAALDTVVTLRQREVLQLIVDGHRTKDIARRLGVSVKTVESHRSDIMRRLGVRNMAALVREALRLKLLPPAD